MSQVNSDVQSTIDNTNAIYQAILDLWTMTPVELKIFIGLLFTITLLMQYVKKSFLSKYSKTVRVRKLWTYSMPLGILLAFAGFKLLGNIVPLWYWIFCGLCISTAAMGIHFVSVKLLVPLGSMIFNEILDRAYLTTFKKPRPKKTK